MTKKIVAIWAQDEKGVIGKEDRLPWHLPAELKHFKETTLNHAILMGRVTFDGMGRRLLPGRETLILTRNPEESIEGALVRMSLTFAAVWAISVLFAFTPWGDAFTCIYSMLQTPLTMLGGTVWALAIAYVIQGIFWFFGINGSNITSPIFTPILTALTLENQAAFAAGTALPNIINREFDAFFALTADKTNARAHDREQEDVQQDNKQNTSCKENQINH